MTVEPEAERDRRQGQAFRNLVAAVVLGLIVLVLAALYLLLWPGAPGAVGAVCTVAFLAVAFLGWEYLMKPGYGLLHRRQEIEPAEEGEVEPPSPRAP